MSFTASIALNFNAQAAISGFQSVANAVKQAQQATQASVSSFQAQANSVKAATTSVQGAITVYNSYGTAVQRAAQSGTSLTGSLSQLSSGANSSQGALRGLEAGLSNSATTSNNANSAIKFLNTSMTSSGTASAAAGTKFNAMGQAISTNVDAAQKTSTSFGSLNNVMGQTSQATEATATSTQKMGVNFNNAVGFMGAAIGSGVQLFETFESLERAQIGVEKVQNRVNSLTTSVARQQAALNQMVKDGQMGSTAYTLAQQKLNDTEDKLDTATEQLKLKQNDLSVTYADFAKNIIPEVISVGATLAGALGNLGVNTSGVREKFAGMIPALTGGATGMRGFAAAIGTVTIAAAPLLIALAAIAAVALAYKTNFLGFRTATDQVGVSMKQLNPVLGIVSDSLKFLAVRLGLVDGDAQKLSDDIWKDSFEIQKAFAEMFSVDNVVKQITNFFAGLKLVLSRGLDVIGEAMGNLLSEAILAPLLNFFDRILPAAITKAADLSGQILKWLNDNIAQPIVKGIAAIPGAIGAAAINLIAIVWTALEKASKPITDALDWLQTNIITPITSAVLSIPSRLTSGFVDLVAIIWTGLKGASKVITDSVEWLRINILAPIISAVLAIPKNLTIGAIDVVAIIWKALQDASKVLSASTLNSWLKTNLFDPIANAIKTGLTSFGSGIAKGLDFAKGVWEALIKNSSDLAGTINKWAVETIGKPLIDGLKTAFGFIPGVNQQLDAFKKKLEEVSPPAKQATASIKPMAAAGDELTGSFQNVALVMNQTTGSYGGYIRVANEAGDATETTSKKMAGQADAAKQSLAALNANVKGLSEYVNWTSAAIDKFGLEQAKELELVQVTLAMADAWKKLTEENKKNTASLEAHELLIGKVEFQEQLRTKGINEQVKVLQDLQDKNIETAASLEAYNRQIDAGTITSAKFTEGVNAQKKSLADMQSETANMLGKLVELDNELDTGANTLAVYDNAWVKAETEFQNGYNKITELDAQIAVLNQHIQDGTAFQQAYDTGLREGTIEFDKFLTSTIEGAAKQEVFNGALRDTANAFGGLPSFMEPTIENTKTFVEAMLGSAEAAQKMHDELAKAFSGIESDASSFVSSIAGKFEDLNKNVRKPFKDLPDYIRKAMTPDDKAMILAAARGEALAKQITGPFSAILATEGPAAAANFLEGVQSGLKNFDDRAALQPIIDGMRSGTAEGVLAATQQLERLKDPMKGVANEMANQYLAGLAQWPRDTKSAVDKAIAVFATMPGSVGEKAQAIAKIFSDLHLQLNDADIQRMSDQLGIPFNTLKAAAGSVPGAVQQPLNQTGGEIDAFVNAAVISTQAFQIVQNNVATVFTNIGTLATQMVGKLTPLWTQIATEAANAFLQIQTNINNFVISVQTGIAPMAAALTPVWTQIDTEGTNAFLQLQTNIASFVASVPPGVQGMVAALTPMWTQIDTEGTNAFLQLQTNIASFVQSVITGIQRIVGPINDAFKRATSDATGYLNTMLKNAQNTFNAVGTAANVIVGPINGAFSRAAGDATGYLNTISRNATAAFTAVGNAGTAAGSRVSNAMAQIASSAQRATQAVNQVKAAIDALKDKTVTITIVTVYKTVGSPGFQHGGEIGGAASLGTARGAFITNRQQKYRGHIIGEFGKPELVLPLTKNASDVADKRVNINALLKKFGKGGKGKDGESEDSKAAKVAFITPTPSPRTTAAESKGRDFKVSGKFENNIPIVLNLDGRKIMGTVQRQLLEFSDATV